MKLIPFILKMMIFIQGSEEVAESCVDFFSDKRCGLIFSIMIMK